MSNALCSCGRIGSHGGNSIVTFGKRALRGKNGELLRVHTHAATGEEASTTSKVPSSPKRPKSTQSETNLSLSRDTPKGFGPRPSPPPPKPSKTSVPRDSISVTSRRPAPESPIIPQAADPEVGEQEKLFIVGLTAIGILIFVEGIALAASGLLPTQLDDLVAKYVYPLFTPTVGVFIAAAVLYGVLKLRQGGGKDPA
ncbi:hypothetical protein KP509_19G031300 [Ceratopteris richardii]|uniref:Uncharacterized protein n=1 Tax=Ceratopteris richardii TaxID=49495 RepID=A0A8T2SJW3_CERRI|nr:hypothetical protein KP509_19G031300 [Ceratopteris richardii]